MSNEIVTKLSNFLKLPKAQRWICCEWFYSDIDKVIFESENDFSLCIKQSFPRLKTRKLNRKQWCILRSLIGKPRRCSDAFFQEERHMLEEKRQKIRLIQQRKVSEKEVNEFKDLPQEIPLPLSIGHRVYAHICEPEEGVFLGTIAAVDPVEHTYRVVFDRVNIGSQTVPDYEIKSVTPVQTIPIKAYVQTYRPKSTQVTPHKCFLSTPSSFLLLEDLQSSSNATHLLTNNMFDPMIGVSSPLKLSDLNEMSTNPFETFNSNSNVSTIFASNAHGNFLQASNSAGPAYLGIFPVRLLVLITRLNKILNVKKQFIQKLNDMNTEAERIKANNLEYTREFQINYATLIIDIEKLNKDLSNYLVSVQRYCEEFAPDLKLFADTSRNSDELRKRCQIEGREMVDKFNKSQNVTIVKSQHIIDLITKLTTLMIEIREYATNIPSLQQQSLQNNPTAGTDTLSSAASTSSSSMMLDHNSATSSSSSYLDTQSINQTINEIKNKLFKNNKKLFEDRVEVHINHIQSSLNHYSNLHAFKESSDKNQNLNDTNT